MDAFGNLTTVVEPDASQTNTNNQATTTYTYDALNHLTNVSMPRRMPGGNLVTQTRRFNYLSGSTITAYLQSATNPENGTVSYTYNADGTLFSKTDAKGQTLKYARDSYGGVLTVSLAGSPDTVLRTYTYDTNSVDNTFSQYSQGRVTTVQYNVPAISSTYDNNNNEIDFTGDTVIEMYSYTSPGQVAAKRLRVTRADSLNENLAADLNGSWTYNNEGKLTGVSYPGDPNGLPAPPTYSYSYDGMGRLAGMTETAPQTLTMVSGVTYNAAGQMTAGLDTRTYNVMGQLTGVVNGSTNITYNYSATQNNGKITSQVDNLTGEQVTYAYDSLNRLISAQAGSTWGQGFAYDPFGNLTDKNVLAGSVPTMHIVPDASTNHLGGEDANGNSSGATWDPENRMISTGTARYAYDGQNKRVWSCTASGTYSWFPCISDTYYFYGPDGKLLTQFTPVYTLAYTDQQFQHHPATLTFQNTSITRSYFGGRMLGAEDRLGSRGGKYFPYGDDRSSPPPANDQVKFATYTRDSATGLDYADQRYYASTYGRFLSADQYVASGGPANPQSWNRYSYVLSDPVNFTDKSGRNVDLCVPDDDSSYCRYLNGHYNTMWGIDYDYTEDSVSVSVYIIGQAWVPGTGGGGGGGGGSPLKNPIPGEQRAYDALTDKCAQALGFATAAQAKARLAGVTPNYATNANLRLIPLAVADTGSGLQVVNGGALSSTNGNNGILINANINWLFPSQTVATNVATGASVFYDWQAALSNQVGANLSVADAQALVILHELEHLGPPWSAGAPQETPATSKQYNTNIYENCLK